MPRGKFINHKGRSRQFTSPEKLQYECSEEELSGNEETEGAAGSSATAKRLAITPNKDAEADSSSSSSSVADSDEEESDEENDRSARKGVAALIEIENPNRAVKKATQKVATLSLNDAPVKPELSRREREQIEKQKAKAIKQAKKLLQREGLLPPDEPLAS